MSDTVIGAGTIDDDEIARFSKLAATWWDENGPMRPLHRINPLRLDLMRNRLTRHFGRDAGEMRPFAGLSLLDIGCGGGLVSEPIARMGFAVTGIDAAAKNVSVAQAHAAGQGIPVDYRHCAAEDLVAEGAVFDAVLALEVVEHVADVASFLGSIGSLVRPGGIVVLSTLNRTMKSFALGIVAAEYVLRWLPRGTHDWAKFLRPSELAAGARAAGLDTVELIGMTYNPFTAAWSLGPDLGVNYLMLAVKPSD